MPGQVGRPPKPTTLKVLHGGHPERVNRSEPKPPAEKVAPPSWLDTKARLIWRELAQSLEKAGVLTVWDVREFAVWCDAVARHSEAAEQVAKEGLILEGQQGPRKHPACQLVRDYAAIVTTYGARFGLSPSDRSRISVGEEKRDDKGRYLS
ncbi:MAG: phage terminase small subunit P27 family [Actinomycetota bacterium]|nr:phage terminase small subunit P27 family [Actinomycetota bacterium]